MVVMMRALIMLLVLIVVPLFVIFGSSFGDQAKEMVLDAWIKLTDTTTTAVTTKPHGVNKDDANNIAPRFLATIVPESPVPESPAISDKKPIALANFEEPIRPVVAEPHYQPPVVDQYTAIGQRLRELGAVYFRLDRLDGPHGEYRFHCEFEDAEWPFTASDADLLQSMQNVLQQVERWKDGRRR